MSKAKTKPKPEAEAAPPPAPESADDPTAIMLGFLSTTLDSIVSSSTVLRAFAVEEIETVGQVIDVYDGWEPGTPDPLTRPPLNLSEFQLADVHRWLCDVVPEALDPDQVLPWRAEADADVEQQADTPMVVEAAAAPPADDLLFKAKSFDQVAELNREVRRLQADWERKHTTASIAKKEYERESAKLSALIAERVDELTAPSLFPVGGEADSGIPENRNEDRLAELQMKYPLTADKWVKYGLTEKDVAKLAAGETKHHGVHPLYTYGDIGRFVKDPQTGFERRLTDIKGLGEAAYNRWLDAELKFQQDWPDVAAAFAAEIGFDLGTQEPMDRVTCDELFALMKPQDRVAVLILLKSDVPGSIQFVTYGRSAEDKVESHQLKKFVQNAMYGGEVPKGTTHESFILEAAKVKTERDELLSLVKDLSRLSNIGDVDYLVGAAKELLARLPGEQEVKG